MFFILCPVLSFIFSRLLWLFISTFYFHIEGTTHLPLTCPSISLPHLYTPSFPFSLPGCLRSTMGVQCFPAIFPRCLNCHFIIGFLSGSVCSDTRRFTACFTWSKRSWVDNCKCEKRRLGNMSRAAAWYEMVEDFCHGGSVRRIGFLRIFI